MTKDKRVGLKPKDRKLATQTKGKKLTANQWQATPQQELFMEGWLTPTSPTFGNAYRSALAAGFNNHYAAIIASPNTNNKWISEYLKKQELTPEHIKQLLQSLAIKANNSRSPDDTRVKALEVLSKIHGMIDRGNNVQVTVVQPILGGESVTRTKVPSEVINQ